VVCVHAHAHAPDHQMGEFLWGVNNYVRPCPEFWRGVKNFLSRCRVRGVRKVCRCFTFYNIPMEGPSYLLSAAVLNCTLFYTLVNTTPYEAHNPFIAKTPRRTQTVKLGGHLYCRVVLTMVVSNAKTTLMTSG
jgi:hypothetical protein